MYPEGYQNKGEDRPTKEVFREELFERLRSQLEEHAAVGGKTPENGDTKVTPITKKATATTTKKTVRKRA